MLLSVICILCQPFSGDLVNGEIDIAVAGMTMTSEREEVIDRHKYLY